MGNVVRSYEELRGALAFYADDECREFAAKGIITERPILGVKIPIVREVVSRVPFECYGEFFELKIEKLFEDSAGEFAVRVGLVMLKVAYVKPEWLEVIFDRVEMLRGREEYYVRMATSWLLAECFVKFPEETYGYLKVSRLPVWTFNQTISKICDSLRVDEEIKK